MRVALVLLLMTAVVLGQQLQKTIDVDKLKSEVDQGLKDTATSLSGPSCGYSSVKETRGRG